MPITRTTIPTTSRIQPAVLMLNPWRVHGDRERHDRAHDTQDDAEHDESGPCASIHGPRVSPSSGAFNRARDVHHEPWIAAHRPSPPGAWAHRDLAPHHQSAILSPLVPSSNCLTDAGQQELASNASGGEGDTAQSKYPGHSQQLLLSRGLSEKPRDHRSPPCGPTSTQHRPRRRSRTTATLSFPNPRTMASTNAWLTSHTRSGASCERARNGQFRSRRVPRDGPVRIQGLGTPLG